MMIDLNDDLSKLFHMVNALWRCQRTLKPVNYCDQTLKCQPSYMKSDRRKCSNWIFRLLLLLNYVLCISSLISSTSSSPLSLQSSPDLDCSQLRDNYRFDFALNIQLSSIVDQSLVIDSSSRWINREKFYHYLVSNGGRLYRFKFNSNFEPVIQFDHHFEQKSQQQTLTDGVTQQMTDVIGQSVFNSIPYDIGFSLLNEDKPFYSTLCFLKIKKGRLSCLDVNHLRGKVPQQLNPAPDGPTFVLDSPVTPSIIGNLSYHRFDFKNFYPSVAFQPLPYTEFDNSKFVVVFLEQNPRIIVGNDGSDETIMESGPDSGPIESTSIVHFERRLQAYSFQNLNHISNQTDSIVLPEYIETVPPSLEITGVFSWKNNKNQQEEYLILAFNGTNHLYCLNQQCQQLDQYKPYLTQCRTPSGGQGPRAMHQRSSSENDYGDSNKHHVHGDHEFGEINSDQDVEESRLRQRKYFVTLLLVASGLLGFTLLLLLVGVVYYSFHEVKYQEKQIERAYNRNILLQMNTQKVLSNNGPEPQFQNSNSAMFAPGTPISSHSTIMMESVSTTLPAAPPQQPQLQPMQTTPILVLLPDNNGNFVSQQKSPDVTSSDLLQTKPKHYNNDDKNATCRLSDNHKPPDNGFGNQSTTEKPTNGTNKKGGATNGTDKNKTLPKNSVYKSSNKNNNQKQNKKIK